MEYIIRYTIPTRFDSAEFGSICKVIGDDNTHELYIQISKIKDAEWIKIRHLLEKTFSPFLTDNTFVEACLSIYFSQNKSQELYKTLGSVLQRGVS